MLMIGPNRPYRLTPHPKLPHEAADDPPPELDPREEPMAKAPKRSLSSLEPQDGQVTLAFSFQETMTSKWLPHSRQVNS